MTKLDVKLTTFYSIKANNSEDAQKVYATLTIEGYEEAKKEADKLDVILEWIDQINSVDCEEL